MNTETIIGLIILLGIIVYLIFFMVWSRKNIKTQKEISSGKGRVVHDNPAPAKTWIEKARDEYGIETMRFGYGPDNKALIFYDNPKLFFWNGKSYSYSSIVSCKLEPFYKTIATGNNQAVSITKTDTGSMIGRALLGTLIWGPIVGGIAGATTAKKTTITTMPDSKSETILDYYLLTILMEKGLSVIETFHNDKRALKAFEKVKFIINENNAQKTEHTFTTENASKQTEQSTIEPVSENVSKDSIIEGLSSLIQMKEKGLLTDEEFAKAKMKLLS